MRKLMIIILCGILLLASGVGIAPASAGALAATDEQHLTLQQALGMAMANSTSLQSQSFAVDLRHPAGSGGTGCGAAGLEPGRPAAAHYEHAIPVGRCQPAPSILQAQNTVTSDKAGLDVVSYDTSSNYSSADSLKIDENSLADAENDLAQTEHTAYNDILALEKQQDSLQQALGHGRG